MVQKIYMTRRKKSFVSEHIHLFCACVVFAMVAMMFLLVYYTRANLLLIFVLPTLLITWFVIFINKRYNWSASTCLLQRNDKLYVVRLFGTTEIINEKSNKLYIGAPSGTLFQMLTLERNIDIAAKEQAYRKSINAIRRDENYYIDGLESILKYIEIHPKKYAVKPIKKRTIFEKLFFYDSENEGFERIRTDLGEYGFLRLNNPELVEERFGALKIRFLNDKKQECSVKITDCYDNLKEDIRAGKFA